MTKEEALLHFSNSEGEFVEFFEEQLFEHKQYFLTKPLIPKIFKSRLIKLQDLEKAFNVLGFSNISSNYDLKDVFFTSNVKETFIAWEQVKSDFKLKLTQAESYCDVERLVNQYLNGFENYSRCWLIDLPIENVKVSLEPDPMELLEAIKEFNEMGKSEFSEIIGLNESNSLLNESKRLTLLSQMMKENG